MDNAGVLAYRGLPVFIETRDRADMRSSKSILAFFSLIAGTAPAFAQSADTYSMSVIVTEPAPPPNPAPIWWQTWSGELRKNTLTQLERGHGTIMSRGAAIPLPAGYSTRQSVLVGPTWTTDQGAITASANLSYGCDPGPQGKTVTQTWEMCPGRIAIVKNGSITTASANQKICAIFTGPEYNLNPTTDTTTVSIDPERKVVTFDAIQHGQEIPGCRVDVHY